MFGFVLIDPLPEVATLIIDITLLVTITGPLIFFLAIKPYVDDKTRDIAKAMEKSRQASKAKSRFLASMSHELRTPMNAVLGFAQMLQFDPQTPLTLTQKKHVESIMEGGNHLLELINEILDLAKIEAGQLDLSLREVNANKCVAQSVALTIPLGEMRGITINDHFSDGPPALILTDLLRLKQVLYNLLSNAIKYNKDGGTVTISGRLTDDDFLRMSVTDTGMGIALEDYESVFEIFYSVGVSPMIAREGTGIGLTVTKLLVERMAGRIGFESEKGHGSTFWFELPLTSNKDVVIWTKNLKIGIDAIDSDHQVLVSLINRISRSTIENDDVDKVLNELVYYTQYHFWREEKAMEICEYPDLEKHRALHRELSEQVGELSNKWQVERSSENLLHLQNFLRKWLINHILKVDTHIAQYTRGRGPEIQMALQRLEQENGLTNNGYRH